MILLLPSPVPGTRLWLIWLWRLSCGQLPEELLRGVLSYFPEMLAAPPGCEEVLSVFAFGLSDVQFLFFG